MTCVRIVRPAAGADLAEIAHGGGGPAGLHDQADQFHDLAFHADGLHPVQESHSGEVDFRSMRVSFAASA